MVICYIFSNTYNKHVNKMSENESRIMGDIAIIFLSVRDSLKMYHWQTNVYSRHKSSDDLVSLLTGKMDEFLETMQGSRQARIVLPSNGSALRVENQSDFSIIELLVFFRKWLKQSLSMHLTDDDVDLKNLRDEIVGGVNKTLYLFTFN